MPATQISGHTGSQSSTSVSRHVQKTDGADTKLSLNNAFAFASPCNVNVIVTSINDVEA